MSEDRYQHLRPAVAAFGHQIADLFDAEAVGLWTLEDDINESLLAQWPDTQRSLFRRQIESADIPRTSKRFAEGNISQQLGNYILKSAVAQNAILIPVGTPSQLLGLILVLNLKDPTIKYHPLAKFTAQRALAQWHSQLQQTKQQRQIEEMTAQNRQWQGIYNGVQESIVLIDLKGKVLSANPATERITGHKPIDSIGKHIGELFPKVSPMGSGIDYPGRSGLFQTLEERRPSDLFEAVVETKDGRHIWVNYTYTPLWDGNGNMIAMVRVTSDVSTIKNVEQMKNDFVSIASHELRTPLGVINGYLNLFLNGQLGELTPDQLTFLERIYHSSTDMSALVEDLLNISRIEAGRLEISVQSFDLQELISEVLNHLEPRYQSKGIHIKLQHPTQSIHLRADRQKVEQALTNIIDNAIKYTYQHGDIAINSDINDGIVSIIIKDTGVGIQPEHIGHIFEKFYRENNPLSVREGGSGLGLYISRKLVELHGGSITVKSRHQKGSIFTIKLPATARKHTG